MKTIHRRVARRYIEGVSDQSTMIALYPPSGLREQIQPHATDDRNLHLTLVYLGELSEGEAKRAFDVLQSMELAAPAQLELDGWGTFANDGTAVRLLLWNNFGLDRLRVDVLDRMDDTGLLKAREHGFIPHMTLEYHDGLDEVPSGWGQEASKKLQDEQWALEQLKVVRGDNEIGAVSI